MRSSLAYVPDCKLMLSFLKKSLSSTSDSFDGSKSKEAVVEDKAVESALEAIHEQELTRWKETVYDIIRVSDRAFFTNLGSTCITI